MSCFDIATTNGTLAIGMASGGIQILQNSSNIAINNASSPLQYPDIQPRKLELSFDTLMELFSTDLGSDIHWGGTRAYFDHRLKSLVQYVDGIGFVKNDRGLTPNTVHLTTSSGSGLSSRKESFGMASIMPSS